MKSHHLDLKGGKRGPLTHPALNKCKYLSSSEEAWGDERDVVRNTCGFKDVVVF